MQTQTNRQTLETDEPIAKDDILQICLNQILLKTYSILESEYRNIYLANSFLFLDTCLSFRSFPIDNHRSTPFIYDKKQYDTRTVKLVMQQVKTVSKPFCS